MITPRLPTEPIGSDPRLPGPFAAIQAPDAADLGRLREASHATTVEAAGAGSPARAAVGSPGAAG